MKDTTVSNTNSNVAQRKYKAIIFDIDGTLYDNFFMYLSAPFIYIRHAFWFRHFMKMRRKLRAYMSEIIRDSNTKSILDMTNIIMEKSVEMFSEETGLPLHAAKIILEKCVYTSWIQGVKRVPLRIGMRKILRRLIDNGVKVGVLSDFRVDEKIDYWNLDIYLSAKVCSENHGIFKPDKNIFQLTCDQLGVSLEETVFVGNHLHYDGIGAAKAGMQSLLFYNNVFRNRELRLEHNIISFSTNWGLTKYLKQYSLL